MQVQSKKENKQTKIKTRLFSAEILKGKLRLPNTSFDSIIFPFQLVGGQLKLKSAVCGFLDREKFSQTHNSQLGKVSVLAHLQNKVEFLFP